MKIKDSTYYQLFSDLNAPYLFSNLSKPCCLPSDKLFLAREGTVITPAVEEILCVKIENILMKFLKSINSSPR